MSSSSGDQAGDQANQDLLPAAPVMIWTRENRPPNEPPRGAVELLWTLARRVWGEHHDGRDSYCIGCKPREMSPCPDQVQAQHGMIVAILTGQGTAAEAGLLLLAREARAWLPVGVPREYVGGGMAGLNVATGVPHLNLDRPTPRP